MTEGGGNLDEWIRRGTSFNEQGAGASAERPATGAENEPQAVPRAETQGDRPQEMSLDPLLAVSRPTDPEQLGLSQFSHARLWSAGQVEVQPHVAGTWSGYSGASETLLRALESAGVLASAPSTAATPESDDLAWEYKVLRVDAENADAATEEAFNGIGADGWELVGVSGERYTFKRPARS